MDYLSSVRVLDTDYKIKDEEAARINHTHKVEEIEGAAKEGHRHQASEIAGLSTVATSGSYSDLNGKPSAATESADGLMTSADKAKLDGIQAGASSYTHPTHTAHASGLYKVSVDSLGHVSSATAVTKSDITALGIPAQDTNTTYGEATANAAGLMSAADKAKLDKAIKSGDELMTTNPFTPGSTLYISKIDNAFYAADKRFNVSAEVERPDGSVVSLDSALVAMFFDGDYESCYQLKDGRTLVLRMKFDNQPSGTFPGYPYGNILVSAYYDEIPKSIGVRLYNSYKPQGVGWKTLVGSHVENSKTKNAWSFRNDYYGVEQIEFTFVGSEDNVYRYAGITQIEMHLDRPYSGRNPFLSKYAAEELYYPLTAPKFIGNLQGTADAAKTADKATTASSATSADNATTADRLKTARKVSISGAVSGSATWDGSGNVNISTTANESYISSPISGLYNMAVDADGNLWVYHSDSDKAPNFEYDSATGNLYYVTEA